MSGHLRRRGGAFELRYVVDGRVHTKTVRCTKKEAERQLRELLGAADRGMHVAASKLTVAEHVRNRVAQWQAAGRITARSAEQYAVLALRIERDLGAIELQRLSTMDVEGWHTRMLARGLAPRTARVAHGLLVAALRDGVKHRLIPRNTAADEGPPAREPPARATCPSAEQIEALEARLAGDAYWYPRLIVAAYCGLRRGELLALGWADVDLAKGRLHVRAALDETKAHGVSFKAPKSSAGRRSLTLPTIVVDTLRAHRQRQLERALLLGLGRSASASDSLVFPGKDGQPQAPHLFTMAWGRVARRLGMPALHWHSLRHSHASQLIAAGIPITTVAARLGHADPGITLRVYAHLFTTDDSAAADAINRAHRAHGQ